MRTYLYVSFSAIIAVSAVTPSPVTAAVQIDWDAASGLYPDQLGFRPYTLVDNTANNPVLSGGILTLNSDTAAGAAGHMGYTVAECDLEMPELLVVEARVKYVSGSTIASFRHPVQIWAVTDPLTGFFLGITDGEIHLLTSGSTVGPSTSLATSDGFHDYRIEANRTTGVVDVYYDGSLELTGAIFTVSSGLGFFETNPQIAWGELSSFTVSVSEWQSFSHNAGSPPGSCPNDVVPEASSLIVWSLIIAAGGLQIVRRRLGGGCGE
jgi:hypothetical protein